MFKRGFDHETIGIVDLAANQKRRFVQGGIKAEELTAWPLGMQSDFVDKNGNPKPPGGSGGGGGDLIVGIVAGGLSIYAIASLGAVAVALVFSALRQMSLLKINGTPINLQLTLAVTVIALGIAAYRMRRQFKRWFGVAQITIGALSGSTAFFSSVDMIDKFLLVTTAIFLVADGVKTISDAFKPNSEIK